VSARSDQPRPLRRSRAVALRPAPVLFMLLIILGLGGLPARAQLSSYVDGRGNLVFTNADLPPKRPTPAKASVKALVAPPASTQTSSAQTATSPAPTPAAPVASAAAAVPQEKLDQLVQQSAEKHHVDPALVRAVISTESNWNARAVSPKGALGLMQLIPGTAQRFGVGNAFDPAQNVDAGVQYLGMLLERYNGDLSKALAAYNAGPGIVDRFGGVPNFRETRNYVQKVTATYFRPGSERQVRVPIYRALESDGRVVFRNE
jgi:soluble lytic murein transglycosylase-like protein